MAQIWHTILYIKGFKIKLEKTIDNNNRHLVIFIHGLTGSKDTFKNENDEYFSEFFSNKIKSVADIAYFVYPSSANIKKYISTLLAKIPKVNKYFVKKYNEDLEVIINHLSELVSLEIPNYEKISFIGHSMGGLIAKGVLINHLNHLNKFNFYITLATPHRGGNFAKIGSFFNNHITALKKDSPFLLKLDTDYEVKINKINTHYYRAIFDKYVTRESSHPIHHNIRPTSIECNHTEIAKPIDNYELGELIQHINLLLEDFLNLKDISFSNNFKESNLFQGIGYSIVDIQHQNNDNYVLLSKFDKTRNVLLKLNENFEIDTSFSNNGIFEYSEYENIDLKKILFDDEFIYIIGHIVINKYFSICILKLKKSNSSFSIKFYDEQFADHRYAMDSIMNLNNDIFTVGKSFKNEQLYLTKIKSNGNIDTIFEENLNNNNFMDNVWLNTIIQKDNYIIVAGRDNNHSAYIDKFFDNGQIDLNFGNNGKVIIKGFLRVEKLAFDSKDNIFIVGVQNEARVVKIKKDGNIDLGFGNNGIFDCIANERTEAVDILVLENDDFIISGHEYDGNSYQNALVAYCKKDGILNEKYFNNGILSFTNNNKCSAKKTMLIKNDLYVFTEYNISYGHNNRIKTSINKFALQVF
ncbi:hypothetical protein [Halarcobacter bivalviorum]|uniref:PGAP/NHL domain-containing protein n=1 Tax=Halarcobacter bivalviorum TaxID=663364 RepID=A0AB33GJY1_9BACT|nr:hypothetical protein [Halarcobacter bivalviorum]AXH12396.1 PGAP/NHL domain-containing protein [Halarcobacter bivalviorum]